MSSVNRDNCTLPFQSTYLISFSYLITLDRTSNKMLNRSGKNEYPCFVPDLGRKTSRCSLLSMLLPVGFS